MVGLQNYTILILNTYETVNTSFDRFLELLKLYIYIYKATLLMALSQIIWFTPG